MTHTEAAKTVTKEKLEHDIKEVLHDAEALVHALAGEVGEKGQEARESLLKKLEKAQERLAALKEAVVEKATAGVKKADETIRSHPYESLALAFGVGLLVGLLAKRR